jgi:hypothetical protein
LHGGKHHLLCFNGKLTKLVYNRLDRVLSIVPSAFVLLVVHGPVSPGAPYSPLKCRAASSATSKITTPSTP